MQNKSITKPIILLIFDGLGYSSKYHGNAVKQARTPNLDFLWHNYPKTLLNASGEHVGLPKNQMGNSEVGHTTIGAGRTINQELARISKSIETRSFFKNRTLNHIYKTTNTTGKKVHIIGLCSNGGIHSHIEHLIALINIGKKYNHVETCLHLITDGRDTEAKNAIKFIDQVNKAIKDSKNIKICTLSGRYYSMDRDCRWTRTEQIYECLVHEDSYSNTFPGITETLDHNYRNGIYDEFIKPTRINKGIINEGDGIIFFNFRPDRMRQLLQAFLDPLFKGFKTKNFNKLHITTFTTYDSTFNIPIVFPKIIQKNFLGKIISENGLKQFRLAETEKYAHITYFFNGGREEPFAGEDRQLIPSPKVNIYDTTPEMSAQQVTDKLIQAIDKNIYQLIIVNYANPDMLGHTGNFLATKTSVEILDTILGDLLDKIQTTKATMIITADHGNAEKMLNKNKPCKSHTTNLVPFIIIEESYIFPKPNNILAQKGSLADIAPTILDLLNINQPSEMNGQSLIKNQPIHSLHNKNKHLNIS